MGTEQPVGQRYLEWSFVTLIVGMALAARLLPGERTVDDAYITFRYARNLVDGAGLVYNSGEHVLGTTTPLYTLLMAGLALVTGSRDFPTLAIAFNALVGAASVCLLYLLGKRFSGHWAPAVGAAGLWAVAPYSVTFAVGGMETDLTVALLVAAAYTHISRRYYALSVLSALALLARPDTAILLAPLWLDLTLARRQIPWREALVAAGLLAPWIVFATLYFGSPLPHSIAAKSAVYRIPAGASAVRLLQHYATPFFEYYVLPSSAVFVVLAIYIGLCVLAGVHAFHRDPRAWPIGIYPFLYFAVFAVSNPLLFRWYLSPPLPFYILLILTGIWTAIHDLGHLLRTSKVDAIPLTLTAAYALVAFGLTLNAWELHPDHGPDRLAPEMAWFKLELLYDQTADIVLAHASPGDVLCAGDIGRLGYDTGLHILDTVGLVTHEAARYYPADASIYATAYAIPADLVLDLNPDHIVILEVYGRLDLLPDPRFQARYQLIEKIETDLYGSDGMLVFGRRI